MATEFDKGMDDYYIGKDLPKNPTIEYLRGLGYAEAILNRNNYQQKDGRIQEQEDTREQCFVTENECQHYSLFGKGKTCNTSCPILLTTPQIK